MLEVQKYLKEKSVDSLKNELFINVVEHEDEPLMILNYDQLDSPKRHPVAMECRGLVLNKNTFEIVAKSFSRFFNFQEIPKNEMVFNFDDFICQSKEDGSLLIIYNFNGKWFANTRGSFANREITNGLLWKDLILKTLNLSDLQELSKYLDPKYTYVCELCTLYNKVVRIYQQGKIYLLSMFEKEKELNYKEVIELNKDNKLFENPELFNFKSIIEIENFIKEIETKDKTFEGVVIRDCHNNRFKIKSSSYLSLHRLKGESQNLFMPKYLIDFVISGETEEVEAYFPEVIPVIEKMKEVILKEKENLREIWEQSKHFESQKEFALFISPKTKLKSILFNMRKYNTSLNEEFSKSSKDILKICF